MRQACTGVQAVTMRASFIAISSPITFSSSRRMDGVREDPRLRSVEVRSGPHGRARHDARGRDARHAVLHAPAKSAATSSSTRAPDIYALGVILYEWWAAIALSTPTPSPTRRSHYEAASPDHELRPRSAGAVPATVHRTMAKDKEQRLRRARELADSLATFTGNVLGPTVGLAGAWPRSPSRRRSKSLSAAKPKLAVSSIGSGFRSASRGSSQSMAPLWLAATGVVLLGGVVFLATRPVDIEGSTVRSLGAGATGLRLKRHRHRSQPNRPHRRASSGNAFRLCGNLSETLGPRFQGSIRTSTGRRAEELERRVIAGLADIVQ